MIHKTNIVSLITKCGKFARIITVLFFVGFFVSCTANRGFVSSVKRAEIQQVQQFEPFVIVGIVEKGDKISYNDSLTGIAQGLFETALSEDKTLPVTGKIVVEDSIVNNRIQYEIYMMMRYIDGRVRVKDIPIPPTIDSILEARNKRFGSLAYSRGFVRTDDNYDREVGKGVAVGLLTLGTYYSLPYKCMTQGGIVIVDSQNNNIAFVSTENFDYHPLKAKTYQKLMTGLVRIFRKQYN